MTFSETIFPNVSITSDEETMGFVEGTLFPGSPSNKAGIPPDPSAAAEKIYNFKFDAIHRQ